MNTKELSQKRQRVIVMVGPALNGRGGIASVCAEYQQSGLLERLGVHYIPSFVSGNAVEKLLAAVYGLFRFAWLLFNRRVSLLHVHMATGASTWRKGVFCWLAQLFKVPYVIHLHSGKFPEYFSRKLSRWQRLIVRSLLLRSTKLVVLSSERVRWLVEQGFDERKIVILPNMVTIPEPKPIAADVHKHDVLFLGRLEEAKGVSDLLQAFAIHLKDAPSNRLLLGGEGDLSRYQALTNELGIASSVDFLGWVDGQRKNELFLRVSILILPSYYEGLPMGILEAMSNSIPCISTSVGGVPDIISDQQNGLLVPCGDPKSLATALTSLTSNPVLRQNLATAARSTIAERYSAKNVEQILRQIYQESTAGRG